MSETANHIQTMSQPDHREDSQGACHGAPEASISEGLGQESEETEAEHVS